MEIDKDEQEKRMKKLLSKDDTKWRVTGFDKWQNKHYKKCENVFDRYMKDTNMSSSRGISLMQRIRSGQSCR